MVDWSLQAPPPSKLFSWVFLSQQHESNSYTNAHTSEIKVQTVSTLSSYDTLSYTIHTYVCVMALPFEKQCMHLPRFIFNNLLCSSQKVMQQSESRGSTSIYSSTQSKENPQAQTEAWQLSQGWAPRARSSQCWEGLGLPLFSPSSQNFSSFAVSIGNVGSRDMEQFLMTRCLRR